MEITRSKFLWQNSEGGGNKPFFRVMRGDLASPPRRWNPGGVKNVTK